METKGEYNVGVNIQALVDELPAGLDRALLRVLGFHVGRANAISRGNLVTTLWTSHGFNVHERAVRAAINVLRKAG